MNRMHRHYIQIILERLPILFCVANCFFQKVLAWCQFAVCRYKEESDEDDDEEGDDDEGEKEDEDDGLEVRRFMRTHATRSSDTHPI